MAEEVKQSSGVHELIARIRDDGVAAGREKANEIVAAAKREAEGLIEGAHAEAAEVRAKALAQIEMEKTAALGALKLAARDTGLELEAAVVASFESWVKRLVAPITHNQEVIRALVLVLAGHAVEQYIGDEQIQVLASEILFRDAEDSELKQRARETVLGITGDMLREGVELIPSSEVEGGARVRLVGRNLEIDLTDEAVHKVLMKHLLPRFRAILEGAE